MTRPQGPLEKCRRVSTQDVGDSTAHQTTCAVEYYSAIKRNEVLTPATTWMTLENMVQ
jgi:hypothetical protein